MFFLLILLFAGGGGYWGYRRWGIGGGMSVFLGTVAFMALFISLLFLVGFHY